MTNKTGWEESVYILSSKSKFHEKDLRDYLNVKLKLKFVDCETMKLK